MEVHCVEGVAQRRFIGIVCNSFNRKERKGLVKGAMNVVEFEIFLKILVLFIY